MIRPTFVSKRSFNIKYSMVLYLFVIGAFVYKLFYFSYSLHVGICEAIIIFLFGPIELIRINWARRGNFTEASAPLWLSLFLSLAVASACVYIALFQAYIAVIEQFGAYVQLALLAMEATLELAAIFSFFRKMR